MSRDPSPGTGGYLYELPEIARTRTGAEVASDADILHRQVRELHGATGQFRQESLLDALEDRRNAESRKSPTTILDELSDFGFAWRDIARITQVSVASVTKWRRGEGVSEPSRRRLAELLALVAMLRDRMIEEPVSWLEMRLRSEVALRPLDLLIGGRAELVLELASDFTDTRAIEQAFDAFDPEWRNTRTDDGFEVFVAEDGIAGIRPKN
ncbi:transcriptional regulator [Nocardia sp. AG03]|uniref:transcriptional regulator n=1 Tax=Nocardia sp. AG03 TaxID=3025312 RepID=UPI0024186392|nr:transcriptional regulator [Nocardia sp. AG03]